MRSGIAGKQVDGIYDSDPKTTPMPCALIHTYNDVLQKNLKVMDASAIALMRDNKMPLIVFSLDEPGASAEFWRVKEPIQE